MKNRILAILGGAPLFQEKLYLTRPALPDIDKLTPHIRRIFESRWLTNNGAYLQEFEKKLEDFLQVPHCATFCNGTLALQLCMQGLRLSGEVITTPFTFAATTHVLHWNNITPVFCDIDPCTLNIDVNIIESLITPKTTAIVPVHVFGNPCDMEKLESIASYHGLKIVIDAAHAFGVKYKGKAIGNYGNASMFSFHATKIFNTMEGGCITCSDITLDRRLRDYMNFGIRSEDEIIGPGINAKMNEIQAAIGILNLENVSKSIEIRKIKYERYVEALKDLPGVSFQDIMDATEYNYAYMPIIIDESKSGINRNAVYSAMRAENILVRKYFSPLISNISCYKSLPSARMDLLPHANEIAGSVLCLPMYDDLPADDQMKVIDLIKSIFADKHKINEIVSGIKQI